MKKVTYNGLTFRPYIENKQIKERAAQLSAQIQADTTGKRPLFICVLNGACPFANDLFMNYGEDAEITFIRLKSYEGTSSTGVVKEVIGLTDDIKGRTVVVVEDIVDTGRTIKRLLDNLKEKQPADIKVATLLFKPNSLECQVKPDYVGFEIPSNFIIGYGLDLDGLCRNLNDIYVLDKE